MKFFILVNFIIIFFFFFNCISSIQIIPHFSQVVQLFSIEFMPPIWRVKKKHK